MNFGYRCIPLSALLLLLLLDPVGRTIAYASPAVRERVKVLYQQYRQLTEAKQFQKALPYARELVRVGEQAFGKDHRHLGMFVGNLAGLHFSLGDFSRAEPLFKRALTIRRQRLESHHPDLAQNLNNLALLYYFQKAYHRAEPLYGEALEIMQQIYSPEHPALLTIVANLADLYREQENYPKAEKMYTRLIAAKEQIRGPNHPDVGADLLKLEDVYFYLGKYEKAIRVGRRALEIAIRHHGAKHPKVAPYLNGLGMLYRQMGRPAEALELHQKALAIRKSALGPQHPQVAISLANIAAVQYSLGNYGAAERLNHAALNIMREAYEPDDPQIATTLSNLATLYHSAGDYDRAENLYRQALAIKERVLGAEHSDVAIDLLNLGGLYKTCGEFARAEPLYLRSLKMIQAAHGRDHPRLAPVLNNLGGFYWSFGRYDQAREHYRRSLSIKIKTLGTNHPDVATGLNNLALVHKSMGDFGRAAELYAHSLALAVKAYGETHPFVARVVSNLGIIYRNSGDFDRAEQLYKRCQAIEEQIYDRNHPDRATTLNNLADIYSLRGNHTQAISLYQQALSLIEKAYGPEHPALATCLHNLARMRQFSGDHEKAGKLLRQSQGIFERSLGREHPHVADSLLQQAILENCRGAFATAHQFHLRAQNLDHRLIDLVLGFTSTRQKLQFLALKNGGLHCFLSLVARHEIRDNAAVIDAFNVWLGRKGMVLEAQKRYREVLVSHDIPEARETFMALSRIRTRLSGLMFASPGKGGIKDYRQKLLRLKRNREDLEVKLSRLSRSYARERKIAATGYAEVAAALPPDSVLVEFARIRMLGFGDDFHEQWLPARYLAFVLRGGKDKSIVLIDLGDAGEIDKAIAAYKDVIGNPANGDDHYRSQMANRLYNLVFHPLVPELGGKRWVIISPDGNLNLIPFEVLLGPGNRFLIQDYRFTYLTTGREILGFENPAAKTKSAKIRPAKIGKALLIGDPDFDLTPPQKASALKRLALGDQGQEIGLGRSSAMIDFSFVRLPGTKAEVEAIHAILGEGNADLYTGPTALEELLLTKTSYPVVHLATHGFFLDDLELAQLVNDDYGGRGLAISPGISNPYTPKPGKIVNFENTLLRSGLALAGANRTLEMKNPRMSDGIVTAEKILNLALKDTDMVVLSACNTGVGEVKTGEGVFGLRSAFIRAGAKSLVMSMWPVPDRETRELMVEFYRNLHTGEMDRSQALRRAVLKEMTIVSARYGHPNPFYWGAFVHLGQP